MAIEILTAAEAAARDRETIDAGVPSRALMERAGAAAAAEIARRFGDRLGTGAVIFAGAGNNGGDAWVVARALAAAGIAVRVEEVEPARTEDAQAERELALRALAKRAESAPTGEAPGSLASHGMTELPVESMAMPVEAARVVIDGVLGTGARGAPRGAAAVAIARIEELGARGATVVALDVPSGLDASTGEAAHAARAELTITFGALKRGHLIARERCGRIVVVDIGLVPPPGANPGLVDARWVRARVPTIAADAHKGTRKRLAIVGGAMGMLGASVLAARAAMRSGIGMVRLVVPRESLPHVQSAAPDTLATAWPESEAEVGTAIADWADALLIGPGLGRSAETRALVERVLRGTHGPVVLDADALNAFEGDCDALGVLLADRAALITPHPAEAGRLAGLPVAEVLARRFEIGVELAGRARTAVLLKGVPTVISGTEGDRVVSATGTPALAMAGSGDLLAGIAATLFAQCEDALAAGACAAWIHGRAGELATETRGEVRGVALDDVLAALPRAWATDPLPSTYPVLAELPAVGAGRRSAR